MKVGVLALQGAFIEHEKKLEKLGVECIELRQKDLEQDFDGLIFLVEKVLFKESS